MQDKLNDDLLSDEEISKVSGGRGDYIPEVKEFPDQLQCNKCGRLISREEFSQIINCPGCGGGIFKVVKK